MLRRRRLETKEAIELALFIATLVYLDSRYNCVQLSTWEKLLQECKGCTDYSTKQKGNGIRGKFSNNTKICGSSNNGADNHDYQQKSWHCHPPGFSLHMTLNKLRYFRKQFCKSLSYLFRVGQGIKPIRLRFLGVALHLFFGSMKFLRHSILIIAYASTTNEQNLFAQHVSDISLLLHCRCHCSEPKQSPLP